MANSGWPLLLILEKDSNRKGDLFTRLATDLFHSLGYEQFSLNVNKSGREIDLQGTHRTEDRRLLAELKSTAKPVGGADLNKFAGAAQVEAAANGSQAAYFVSLSGFAGTAIAQEGEVPGRLILLDGRLVVEELITGHIVCTPEQATLAAGALREKMQSGGPQLTADLTLLAHEAGWVWAVRMKAAGDGVALALVHADGHLLSPATAERVYTDLIAVDEKFGLIPYMPPPESAPMESERLRTAEHEYRKFLIREANKITFEGLPTDESTGSRTVDLASIYVPLEFRQASDSARSVDGPAETSTKTQFRKMLTIDEVVSQFRHAAVLGIPGSGKSTLIKRLAVDYAKTPVSADSLDSLPVLIRCRQVITDPSITMLSIIEQALKQSQQVDAATLLEAVLARLRTGRLLLLVDGLDEIPDIRARIAFSSQLRTFLGTYPQVRLLLTSREVGFRAVSGAIGQALQRFHVMEMSDSAIRDLCKKWYTNVLEDTDIDAGETVATTILANSNLTELAINPLLLTTLLLVKRWLGELPSKRGVLYGKAIEVLLMTWNVAGHEPIDDEEALPQLAYAALSMMSHGQKMVSSEHLRILFDEAREELPEVLGYAKLSSRQLISRIEERSSLLVATGHEVEEGELRAMYSFKHLTFQEYLAALAIARGWYSTGTAVEPSAADILFPYLDNPEWTQVVALTATLSGRAAGLIVSKIISQLGGTGRYESDLSDSAVYASLHQCIVDGVPIAPGVARSAIDALIRFGSSGPEGLIRDLRRSRFADELESVVWEGLKDTTARYAFGGAIAELQIYDQRDQNPPWSAAMVMISDTLQNTSNNMLAKAKAWFTLMLLAYSTEIRRRRNSTSVRELNKWFTSSEIKDQLRANLSSAEIEDLELFSMLWALPWLTLCGSWAKDEVDELRTALLRIINRTTDPDIRRLALWSFWRLPIHDNDGEAEWNKLVNHELLAMLESPEWNISTDIEVDTNQDSIRVAIVLGVLRTDLVDPPALQRLIDKLNRIDYKPDEQWLQMIMSKLPADKSS